MVSETDIRRYLADCYANESPPRVSELAKVLGMHPVILRRRIKDAHGVTASRYLKTAQIRFACELLGGGIPLREIARRAAFGTPRSFFRAFRRELRISPAVYRSASSKMSLDTRDGGSEIETTQA
jgi:AraC-like DNA-binding protein